MFSTENIASLIVAILYIAFFVIAILAFFTVLNYLLYTIFCIDGIVKQNTYNSAPFFKLNQIYHYYLINYVHFLNKDRIKRYRRDDVFYKKKEIKDFYVESDITKDVKYPDKLKKYRNLEKYEHVVEKDINIEYDENIKKNYGDDYINKNFNLIVYFNDYSYIKNQIDYLKDDKNIYIKSPLNDGNYCLYKKIDEDYDLFQNISRYIWELYYIFSESNDEKASGLYIHKANLFYEMILFAIYIIFAILVGYYIIITAYALYNGVKTNEDIFSHLYTQKFHIILIIFTIFIFAFIHETLYKKLFIDNVYNDIYHKYSELYKIDLQLQAAVNDVVVGLNYLKNINDDTNNIKNKVYNIYSNTIENLKQVAHQNYLNYRDTIIEFKSEELYEEQLKKFETTMKTVNRDFNISSSNANIKIQEYTTAIKDCFELISNKIITTDANYLEYVKDLENITAKLIFILSVYIYLVGINSSDPYILIKLNKLILGHEVVIGEENIDKNLEYTLTVRSIMYNEEEVKDIKSNLINIANNIINKAIDGNSGNQQSKDNITTSVTGDGVEGINGGEGIINTFIKNVELANDNLNFFIPVYFVNLYLILEVALVFLVILLILYIYLAYDDKILEETRESIENLIDKLNIIKDEIQTAVLGVI
jgi:hypothetical protein